MVKSRIVASILVHIIGVSLSLLPYITKIPNTPQISLILIYFLSVKRFTNLLFVLIYASLIGTLSGEWWLNLVSLSMLHIVTNQAKPILTFTPRLYHFIVTAAIYEIGIYIAQAIRYFHIFEPRLLFEQFIVTAICYLLLLLLDEFGQRIFRKPWLISQDLGRG